MMNNIESLDELIAERKRLKEIADGIEMDFRCEVNSLSESFRPITSIFRFSRRITELPVIRNLVPRIPVISNSMKNKGAVAGVVTTFAVEALISLVPKLFRRKRK